MPITIVVASENPLLSELTWRELSRRRENFHVVASAQTTKDLLQEVSEHQPNVTLISPDLDGETHGGFKALLKLRACGSTTRPVVLLDSPEPEMLINVFAAGARGVVSMREPVGVLCECIRSVHAGHVWANGCHLEWIVEAFATREPICVVKAKGIRLLTRREEQVISMVAEGLPNNEISTSLGVRPHTVKNELFRIYEKLGVSNRVELLLYILSDHGEK